MLIAEFNDHVQKEIIMSHIQCNNFIYLDYTPWDSS